MELFQEDICQTLQHCGDNIQLLKNQMRELADTAETTMQVRNKSLTAVYGLAVLPMCLRYILLHVLFCTALRGSAEKGTCACVLVMWHAKHVIPFSALCITDALVLLFIYPSTGAGEHENSCIQYGDAAPTLRVLRRRPFGQ
jgi:hypothetical protein